MCALGSVLSRECGGAGRDATRRSSPVSHRDQLVVDVMDGARILGRVRTSIPFPTSCCVSPGSGLNGILLVDSDREDIMRTCRLAVLALLGVLITLTSLPLSGQEIPEPPRDHRRLFCLSQAAMADSSCWR